MSTKDIKGIAAWVLVAILAIACMGLSAAGAVFMTDRDRLAERLKESESHVRYYKGQAAKMEEARDEEVRAADDRCTTAMWQQREALEAAGKWK